MTDLKPSPDQKRAIRQDFESFRATLAEKYGLPGLAAYITFGSYQSKSPHLAAQRRLAAATGLAMPVISLYLKAHRNAPRFVAGHLGKLTGSEPVIWTKDCPGTQEEKAAARHKAMLEWDRTRLTPQPGTIIN